MQLIFMIFGYKNFFIFKNKVRMCICLILSTIKQTCWHRIIWMASKCSLNFFFRYSLHYLQYSHDITIRYIYVYLFGYIFKTLIVIGNCGRCHLLILLLFPVNFMLNINWGIYCGKFLYPFGFATDTGGGYFLGVY